MCTKSEELLHQPSCKELPSDPTTKHKNRLISLLKTIKSGGTDNITYKSLYPTGIESPKYYGLPKIHKTGVPLIPIISSRGSATYEIAKELAKILKPLVGRSPHHVQNSKGFQNSIKTSKIKPDECIMSYDVSTLFTLIPIEPTINIIEKHLKEDKDLYSRTNMKIQHIISILRFCLNNSYFSFQGRFYQQTGAAIGSPISPIVANLFMEDLEVQAIQTSSAPPALWKRFVDDTFTIIKKEDRNSLLQHLNSIHQNIKVTTEEVRDDGSMPFLDILITPKEDSCLSTSVFRKPTHTDLYLQWDSHHIISTKYSLAGTLCHRAKTICCDPQLLQMEEDHLCQALQKCNYPTWAINRVKLKSQNPSRNTNRNSNNNQLVRTHLTTITYTWWSHTNKG